MDKKQSLIIDFKMKLAFKRQFLKDLENELSEEEKDEILDDIILFLKIIEELEKK